MVLPHGVFLLAVMLVASMRGGQSIERKDFTKANTGIFGEEKYYRVFNIGHGVKQPVSVEVSGKGNGTLTVANLRLTVLDEHNDGDLYEGGLLHVEFVDITGDGYKDLVICGILIHTGEKETDAVTREPVCQIYVFDSAKRSFVLKFKQGPDLAV